MTDIMKLADDYAQHKYVNGAEGRGPDAPEARTGYARAALQSAIEALQEENALLEGTLESRERNIAEMQAENERLNKNNGLIYVEVLQLRNERDALQSKVNAMGKGEAVQFLCDATRFKLTFDARGRVSTMWAHMNELEGRWVALVAADDDRHLKLAAPKALAPLTDEQIYNVFAATVEDAEPFAELVGDPIWAEVVEITRSIEAAHGIHAKGGQHEDA